MESTFFLIVADRGIRNGNDARGRGGYLPKNRGSRANNNNNRGAASRVQGTTSRGANLSGGHSQQGAVGRGGSHSRSGWSRGKHCLPF